MTSPLLSMTAISKSFGGVPALSEASLEVMPAEIMALVGQNGAGKSTMIKIINGAYVRDSGSISFAWQPLDRGLAAAGAARRHQHHLPGDQPDRLPLGGREHLSWPRAQAGLRPARLGADECGGRGPAGALRREGGRARAAGTLLDGDPADGGDCPRRLLRCAAGHHGRADILAGRGGSGGAAAHHPAAEGRRRCRDLRQPQAGRALRGLRPRHHHAGWPHHCRVADEGHLEASAGRQHAGARPGGSEEEGRHRLRGRRRQDRRRVADGGSRRRRAPRARCEPQYPAGRDRRSRGPAGLRAHGDGARHLRRRQEVVRQHHVQRTGRGLQGPRRGNCRRHGLLLRGPEDARASCPE